MSSAIGLIIRVLTAGIKEYKSTIKKKKKKHGKILGLPKYKFNSIEVLISKALVDSNVSHDELILKNNVPEEFDDMKEEIKIPMTNKSLNYI